MQSVVDLLTSALAEPGVYGHAAPHSGTSARELHQLLRARLVRNPAEAESLCAKMDAALQTVQLPSGRGVPPAAIEAFIWGHVRAAMTRRDLGPPAAEHVAEAGSPLSTTAQRKAILQRARQTVVVAERERLRDRLTREQAKAVQGAGGYGEFLPPAA